MHPDDDLVKKRLGEKFANYEPETSTTWRQVQEKMPLQTNPSRRWRVGIGVFVLLLIGLLGYWVGYQINEPLAQQARVPAPGLSDSLGGIRSETVPIGAHSVETKKSTKSSLARQLAGQAERTTLLESRYKKPVSEGNSVGITSHIDHTQRFPPTPGKQSGETIHLSLGTKSSISWAGGQRLVSSAAEQTPSNSQSTVALSERVVDRPMNKLEPFAIASMINSPTTWTFRQLTVPALKMDPPSLFRQEPRLSWVIKGGPLLGYRLLQAQQRGNYSARNFKNLNSSLPGRLGWQLYFGQQRLLSRSQQWTVGVVYRQFAQGIQYQLPNGEYLVAVQPSQSVTVTQVRDTLTDQTMVRQTGLQLGYRIPLLGQSTSRLYLGVGGEFVYQFNLNRPVLNGELTVGGTTLTRQGRPPVLVELFANTALHSIDDKSGWVRVLPYQIGIRIGVLLAPVR
jgi:hypothetical protein